MEKSLVRLSVIMMVHAGTRLYPARLHHAMAELFDGPRNDLNGVYGPTVGG